MSRMSNILSSKDCKCILTANPTSTDGHIPCPVCTNNICDNSNTISCEACQITFNHQPQPQNAKCLNVSKHYFLFYHYKYRDKALNVWYLMIVFWLFFFWGGNSFVKRGQCFEDDSNLCCTDLACAGKKLFYIYSTVDILKRRKQQTYK